MFGPKESEWKEKLNEIALIGDDLAMEVRAYWQHTSQHAIMAAADVLTNGVTTLLAIRLLLANGYVVDAEARWRALHELACTTALIAGDADPGEISKRYLVHGGRLAEGNKAYAEPWVTHGFSDKPYEWLRASHPHLGKSGRPQRFQQAWLFENARLAHSGFAEWVKPSHGPVHLNSITVARGVVLDGPSPAGYDTYVVVQVAWQALCSFYELAVQASLLACGPALDIQRALSWSELLYERVESMRPGWSLG
ncbi:MAG TPA: DUF5677 domain-containing protein [Nocardioides sp.]|uniref:DUF5677 domain-containing protein n=1 Tax=uncultured Nocardioides sp. TaxID=198441 RepID=UPI000EC8C594|nr:DUF5677 domain-containing protein [uncultured Nocardioides sp.]HCB02937.1 hypothetical protein [Nocardioides sp.]HRD61676.1 DUF5677 domain-containing protein [Nocardioides sp.]HRI95180.1 DUF5677 domain-containing protein [Nocardioides sp.]HRK45613.1 DUF5677 domain-containing protein [Nocardioides sp.]